MRPGWKGSALNLATLRNALFCVFTQPVMLISYRHFGKIYRTHLQRSRIIQNSADLVCFAVEAWNLLTPHLFLWNKIDLVSDFTHVKLFHIVSKFNCTKLQHLVSSFNHIILFCPLSDFNHKILLHLVQEPNRIKFFHILSEFNH